eukprot:872589-Pelagomonas_calceolata.AAC.2
MRFIPNIINGAPANSAISELRGLYEEAMREAASSETTPSFSTGLASTADFTDYCTLALPEVCAEHYRESLGGEKDTPGLQMTFGKQFQVTFGKHLRCADGRKLKVISLSPGLCRFTVMQLAQQQVVEDDN